MTELIEGQRAHEVLDESWLCSASKGSCCSARATAIHRDKFFSPLGDYDYFWKMNSLSIKMFLLIIAHSAHLVKMLDRSFIICILYLFVPIICGQKLRSWMGPENFLLGNPPYGRGYNGLIGANNFLYVFGGFNGAGWKLVSIFVLS